MGKDSTRWLVVLIFFCFSGRQFRVSSTIVFLFFTEKTSLLQQSHDRYRLLHLPPKGSSETGADQGSVYRWQRRSPRARLVVLIFSLFSGRQFRVSSAELLAVSCFSWRAPAPERLCPLRRTRRISPVRFGLRSAQRRGRHPGLRKRSDQV